MTIRDLKPGDYFTLKQDPNPGENLVWVRDGYDRTTRKYGAHKWADICHESEFKPDRVVYTDFTF